MSKLKILFIEDDKIIAKNLKEILEKWGYEVVDINTTAEDAFETLYDKSIDLVISDIEIRGLIDGIDASKILQDIYDLPIIFITAYSDDEKIQRASKLKNMVGYLVKPIKIEELKALIEMAIMKYDIYNNKKIIKISDLYSYDKKNKALLKNGEEVELTKNEKLLLSVLINNDTTVTTYEMINEAIWNCNEVSDGTRRQLIHRLKGKLEDIEIVSKKGQGIYLKNSVNS
jgi:DNA-binding response OmpR family regulator